MRHTSVTVIKPCAAHQVQEVPQQEVRGLERARGGRGRPALRRAACGRIPPRPARARKRGQARGRLRALLAQVPANTLHVRDYKITAGRRTHKKHGVSRMMKAELYTGKIHFLAVARRQCSRVPCLQALRMRCSSRSTPSMDAAPKRAATASVTRPSLHPMSRQRRLANQRRSSTWPAHSWS